MRWWKVTLATPKKKEEKKAAHFITRVAKGLACTVARTCNSQNNCSVQIHLLRYAIRIEIRLNAKQICSQCKTNLFSMQNKFVFNAKQNGFQCKTKLISMQNKIDRNAKQI